MANSIGGQENAKLLLRTVRGIVDFTGRSRRTEVLYYAFAVVILVATIDFAFTTSASFTIARRFDIALQLLFAVPTFALFVRRLHDQNRSGVWGILLPLAMLLALPSIFAQLRGDIHEIVAQRTMPLALLDNLLWLIILVFWYLPGTPGSNRFGPDPRLQEA